MIRQLFTGAAWTIVSAAVGVFMLALVVYLTAKELSR